MTIDPLELQFLAMTVPITDLVRGVGWHTVPSEIAMFCCDLILNSTVPEHEIEARLPRLFAAADEHESATKRYDALTKLVIPAAALFYRAEGYPELSEEISLALACPPALGPIYLRHQHLVSSNWRHEALLANMRQMVLVPRLLPERARAAATALAHMSTKLPMSTRTFGKNYAAISLEILDLWLDV